MKDIVQNVCSSGIAEAFRWSTILTLELGRGDMKSRCIDLPAQCVQSRVSLLPLVVTSAPSCSSTHMLTTQAPKIHVHEIRTATTNLTQPSRSLYTYKYPPHPQLSTPSILIRPPAPNMIPPIIIPRPPPAMKPRPPPPNLHIPPQILHLPREIAQPASPPWTPALQSHQRPCEFFGIARQIVRLGPVAVAPEHDVLVYAVVHLHYGGVVVGVPEGEVAEDVG